MDDRLFCGAIEWEFEYDQRAGWLVDVPTPIKIFSSDKIQYNQKLKDPMGCTRYAVMTCVTNNWDITWTKEDFDYMRVTAPSYWWTPKNGMYLSKAGDMVVDYLNTLHPWQWWTKLEVNTIEEWLHYMNLWYCLHMWSQINKVYTDDIQDWLITDPRGKTWQWHSRTTIAQVYGTSIVENYVWFLPYNVIDIRSWKELMDARQLFTYSFIYYTKQKMPVDIPYPYMTVEQAESLEKKYPDLFTSEFSESVRAWIDLAKEWKLKYWYRKYLGIDGVMKMMIDINTYRAKN